MSTTYCHPKRGPTHPIGASLDYSLDFAKALQPGELVMSATLRSTSVTASLLSNDGTKLFLQVTAAADLPEGTEADVEITATTNAAPVRVFVQTLQLQIGPVYAVQIA